MERCIGGFCRTLPWYSDPHSFKQGVPIAMSISRRSRLPVDGFTVRLALFALLAAIFGGLASNCFYDVMKLWLVGKPECPSAMCHDAWIRQGLWLTGIGIATAMIGITVGVFQVIPKLRDGLFRSLAVITPHEEAEPRRGLILTLSPLDLANGKDAALVKSALERSEGLATAADRAAAFADLIDAKGAWAGWRWQQPLRVIAMNSAVLEVVAFVLTREAAPQYADCLAQLLARLLPVTVRIHPSPHVAAVGLRAIDMSNYNDVTYALDNACREVLRGRLADGSKLELSDLCIDISGGTKAFTAAATVKTLNSAMVFSYVETFESPRVGQVAVYDASIVT